MSHYSLHALLLFALAPAFGSASGLVPEALAQGSASGLVPEALAQGSASAGMQQRCVVVAETSLFGARGRSGGGGDVSDDGGGDVRWWW